MKLISLVFLVFLVCVAQAQRSAYTKISFTWNYSPNLAICSSQLVSCFSGFTMSDELSGHTLVTLGPSARSWVFSVPGGVWYGKHIFDLVATGYDVNGTYVQSTPDKVIVDVEPPPTQPSNLLGDLGVQ